MCLAVPGEVTSVGDPRPGSIPAEVVFDGVTKPVNLVMIPETQPGDYIITHSGFGIRLVAAEEVQETLELHEQGKD